MTAERPSGRLWLGFAAMPPLAALLGYVGFPLVSMLGDFGTAQPANSVGAAFAFAMLAGLLAVLVTLCGVIPMTFWLIGRGRVALRDFAIAGLALGNVPFAVYVLVIAVAALARLADGSLWQRLLPLSELAAGTLRALTIGSAFGVTLASLFWTLTIRPYSPHPRAATSRSSS